MKQILLLNSTNRPKGSVFLFILSSLNLFRLSFISTLHPCVISFHNVFVRMVRKAAFSLQYKELFDKMGFYQYFKRLLTKKKYLKSDRDFPNVKPTSLTNVARDRNYLATLYSILYFRYFLIKVGTNDKKNPEQYIMIVQVSQCP